MKVRDFAKKIRHASLPFSVGIRRGTKYVEHIDNVKNLETNSCYLNETVNSIVFYETLTIINIK